MIYSGLNAKNGIRMSYSFNELGLIEELLTTITEQGYKEPTTVQLQAIPYALKNRDIQASAQTGTGKTAAFILPILQKLNVAKSDSKNPRALILAPTRELARQVYDNAIVYGANLDLKVTAVYGKASVKSQVNKLAEGTDILIATPGRLLDHLAQGAVCLDDIRFFVLDEISQVTVFFFSDKGKVYRKRVFEVPEAARNARGRAIVNFVGMEPGEKVAAMVHEAD